MSKDRSDQPSDRRPGDWFVHAGDCKCELESTTSASLRHVLNSAASQGMEYRLPLEYKGREQKAGNNNFPFSSHDNRHDICNAAEYFDLGMGLRKLDPEKQKQNSHNLFQWAGESTLSGMDGLTIYQTSFMKDEYTGNTTGLCCRRYPKHHTQPRGVNKPVPEDEETLQPESP